MALPALLFCLLVGASTARAADQVVNDCSTDAELRGDLFAMQNSGGGTLTFACGAATIALTGNVLPNIDAATVVDGGGQITLSGGNAYRIFTTGIEGNLTLKDITLTLGRAGGAADDGGCIWNYGTLKLDNVTIEQCYAGRDGGAIYNYTGGSVTVANSILRHNTANRDCGAICDYGSLVSVLGSSILTNTAQTRNVGGVGSVGFVQITNSIVRGNGAPGNGGGLFSNNYMALTGVTLSHNSANACGGGLFVGAGTTAIYASTIYSNTSQRDPCAGTGLFTGGGGIAVWGSGTVHISDSTLVENATKVSGGGLYVENGGAATLERVALVGNRGGNGGGISITGGAITLTNTTFKGNFAGYYGGALDELTDTGAASARLTNVTMVGNHTANFGAGGIRSFGGLWLRNTLLANNKNANCASTGMYNAGFNLSSDNTCFFGGGGDNVDPLLGPFGEHGGFTQTYLLRVGSPAIDTGTLAGCPPTDQRGYARPVGASCDIGAVERRTGDLSELLRLPLIRR